MILYKTDRAVNPERVTRFIAEKGHEGDFEYREISIMSGEHLTDDYKRISPLRQIPVLELDDGTRLTESRAICTYIEDLYPTPNLMGETGLEKAQIEMWDRRVELLLMMSVAMGFRHSHPLMASLEDQVVEYGEKSKEKAQRMFEWFDKQLAQQDFFAGSRFSIADITAWCTSGFARLIELKAFDLPNWQKWKERVGDHRAMQ